MPYIDATVDSKMLRDGGGWDFTFTGELSGTDESDIEELDDLPWRKIHGSIRNPSATKWFFDKFRADGGGFYRNFEKNSWRGTRLLAQFDTLSVLVCVDAAQAGLWESSLDAALYNEHLELEFLIGGDMGSHRIGDEFGGVFFDAIPEFSVRRKLAPEVAGFRKLFGLKANK